MAELQLIRQYPNFEAIKAAAEEEHSNRAVEDLENRQSAQSKNLETLKKVCEDLFAKVEQLETRLYHLEVSTMGTAKQVTAMLNGIPHCDKGNFGSPNWNMPKGNQR